MDPKCINVIPKKTKKQHVTNKQQMKKKIITSVLDDIFHVLIINCDI